MSSFFTRLQCFLSVECPSIHLYRHLVYYLFTLLFSNILTPFLLLRSWTAMTSVLAAVVSSPPATSSNSSHSATSLQARTCSDSSQSTRCKRCLIRCFPSCNCTVFSHCLLPMRCMLRPPLLIVLVHSLAAKSRRLPLLLMLRLCRISMRPLLTSVWEQAQDIRDILTKMRYSIVVRDNAVSPDQV